jgi:hypothetical protein
MSKKHQKSAKFLRFSRCFPVFRIGKPDFSLKKCVKAENKWPKVGTIADTIKDRENIARGRSKSNGKSGNCHFLLVFLHVLQADLLGK